MTESKAAREAREEAEREEAEAQLAADHASGIADVVGDTPTVAPDDCGYRPRVLANGTVDFVSDHDQWTTPDEALMIAHVSDYRARRTGRVSG